VLATAFASASKSEGKTQIGKLTGASQRHFQELLSSSQTGKPASSAAYADHPALTAFHTVQAHGSGHGFTVAAIFGIVSVVAAIVLINVKKRDMVQVPEAVAA